MAPVPISESKVGHIDDVQEVKKTKSPQIPERFIRDSTERPKLDKSIHPWCNNIPVIDFSKLSNGNKDDFCSEIFKIKISCEWGFFQVTNHENDLQLLEKIEKVAMEFFTMPLEEKKKYPMSPGTVQGYGQAFVFAENQKLDWCNMFASLTT